MFNETAKGLLATSDGGYLLLGDADSMDGDVACGGPPQNRAWAVKVDAVGGIQWQSCLWGDSDGSSLSWIRSEETVEGGYMIVGGSSASQGVWHENHGGGDLFVAKLDSAGQLQWLHCYGGSGREDGFAIRSSPDGNFVVAGTTGSSDGQITTGTIGQIWVIKIDPEGNLLWNRRMGGSNGPGLGQEVRDLVVDPDGTILVVGSVGANDGDISGNHGEHDFWLVRLDPTGDIMDQRCLGGDNNDYAWGAASAGAGRYVVAGWTNSNEGDVNGNNGYIDAWVLMVDSSLNLIWQKCLGGSARDAAYAMARTSNGEIIISGATFSSDGDVSGLYAGPHGDIWIVKLANEISAGVADPKALSGITTYPSPATDQVTMVLPVDLMESSTLEVLDITGRAVLHKQVAPGARKVRIDVSAWAAGTYCLRLHTGNEVYRSRFAKQ